MYQKIIFYATETKFPQISVPSRNLSIFLLPSVGLVLLDKKFTDWASGNNAQNQDAWLPYALAIP